jgi:D-Tyr-tRNAtyr deacylase
MPASVMRGNMRAIGNPVCDIFATKGFVVTMKAQKWFFDAEMLQEKTAMPRILSRYQIRRLENLHGAQGDILTVSNRSRNDAQHGKCPGFTTPR